MTESEPFFSVVIPTHNRRATLEDCLRSLDAQTLPADRFEVIVVDDGSSDGTTDAVRARQAPYALSVLRTEQGGPGKARNVAAARARGRYLAFTEDDVTIEPDWLAQAHRLLAADARIDVLDGHTATEGRALRRAEDDVTRHPAFIPCNLFVRRGTFEAVGGYDPDFFDPASGLYFREDADLGFRLLEAGAVVQVAPELVVHHPPQFETVEACLRHARRYMADALLYRKHPRSYRELIEVKTVAGVKIRRPLHYAALLYAGSLAAAAVAALRGRPAAAAPALLTAAGSMTLFRARYQGGRGALRVLPARDTAQFLRLPLVYLWALARGAWRFRTPRVFL